MFANCFAYVPGTQIVQHPTIDAEKKASVVKCVTLATTPRRMRQMPDKVFCCVCAGRFRRCPEQFREHANAADPT